MKKIFFFLALTLPVLAIAQRPVQGMQSFTFGLSGLSNLGVNSGASRTGTILYRKYTTDSAAFRFSAFLSVAANRVSLDNEATGTRAITQSNSASVNIAPGYQKSLGGSGRVEPYYGIDVLVGYTFTNSIIQRTEIINADTTFDTEDETGDFEETETAFGTPFRFGIMPLIGVNYYLLDNIAIGAEFSYGLIVTTAMNGQKIIRRRIKGVDQEEVRTSSPSAPSNMNFSANSFGTGLVTMSIYF
jgi:hypothetical protein